VAASPSGAAFNGASAGVAAAVDAGGAAGGAAAVDAHALLATVRKRRAAMTGDRDDDVLTKDLQGSNCPGI
jgi:hypothetical protein